MKDKVLAAYSKLALDYEKNVDTASGFNAFYERPAVMQLLQADLSGKKILDAGCAAGWYTEQFVQRGADVTAIDLSPEMVAATRKRVGSHATVLEQDLSDDLPFDDETFDVIVSSLTLHYIEHWEPVFQELSRVMKPGGQFVFSVHHPLMDFKLMDRPDYFAHAWLQDVWDKKEAGRVEVTFYRRPLAEIINIAAAHFQVERIVEPQPTAEFTQRLPHELRAYEYLMKNPHFLIIASRKPV